MHPACPAQPSPPHTTSHTRSWCAQTQTAECVAKALKAAGCDVSVVEAKEALEPNADPALAVAMLKGAAPTIVFVGHLPHVHLFAAALGSAAAAEMFTPGGGVVLELLGGDWALTHVVAHKTNWWIQGVSQYLPAEE